MPSEAPDPEAVQRECAAIAALVSPQPPASPTLLEAARALQALGRWIVCSADDPQRLAPIAAELRALAERAGATAPGPSRWIGSERLPERRPQPNAREMHPLLGRASPVAPPLALRVEGERVVAEVCFDARFEGNVGWAHGGFVAAGFDIVLVQAARLSGRGGPTGSLSVRFREPTPIGEPLHYTGWFERAEGRKLVARGELQNAALHVLAEAEAIVVAPRGSARL